MNIDSLKQHWQNQPTAAGQLEPTALLAATLDRSRRFNRAARQRTVIGVTMFLLPLPLLVMLFFVLPGATSMLQLAGVALIGFLLFGAGLIVWTGVFKSDAASLPNQSVERFLINQLRKVGRQAWLFRNMVWWYWTPMLTGAVILALVMVTGLIPVTLFALIAVCFMPLAAVYGMRHARKFQEREIFPWQREFENCLHSLQDGNAPN